MKTVIDWKQPWGIERILEVAKSLDPEDLKNPFDEKVDKIVSEMVVGEVPDLAKRLFVLVHEIKKVATSLVPIHLVEGREELTEGEKKAVEDVFGSPPSQALEHVASLVETITEMAWFETKCAIFDKDSEKVGGFGIRENWAVVTTPKTFQPPFMVHVVSVPR